MADEIRVLLVEDSITDAELEERELRRAGLAVAMRRVENAEDFERELAAFSPDMILADHRLPLFSGLEALRMRNQRCPDVPFIFISGGMGEEQAVEMLRAGATDYVIKDRPQRLGPAAKRALAEAEVRASQKQIADLYQALLDTAPDMIMVMDAGGRIKYANPAAVKACGRPREELMGKAHAEMLSPASLPAHAEAFQRACGGAKAPVELEETIRTPAGERCLISRLAALPPTPAGNAVMMICQDVTDKKQAEKEKAVLHGQLMQAQKLESVGRLASGVAHDFNNILTAISGYGEMLLAALPEADPKRSAAEEIVKTGQRAWSLVRQLLAFSREQVQEARIMDLNAEIADVEKMLRRLIGEDIVIELSLASGLSYIHADPHHIDQVIINLAVNARDAMPAGGRLRIATADVELDAAAARSRANAAAGTYVRLTVADTGIGMDDNIRQHLFEPFFTTKGPGQGTGLGLAMVWGVVQRYGGFPFPPRGRAESGGGIAPQGDHTPGGRR